MNKKQIEAKLAELKKQKSDTLNFITELEKMKEHASKIKFDSRTSSLFELIEQETYYLAIINVKINNITNQLKKWN